MIYVKDSLPHRILEEYTGIVDAIEYMSIELSMKARKWNIIYIYKPPMVLAKTFWDFMHSICENFAADDKLCIFMGDMNCNMLVKNELTDICDIYGLNNLIKDPTCFKSCNGTALDVILTNKPRCFSDTFNIDIGLSDFHNGIGVASKMYAPAIINRRVNYRCMRKFDDDSFAYDVSTIPFHICNIFEDVDDIYIAQQQLLMSVVNEHAPPKTKFVSGNQVPYMNSELHNMWRGKHFRDRRNKKYRAMYVNLRNKVVKLHKQSIKTNIRQRRDTQNGNKFFKTIKPFLSDNNSNGCGNKVVLKEEDCILSRPQDVADVFNRYLISIGDYDGEPDGVDELAFHEAIKKHASHESIKPMLENCSPTMKFNFKHISDGMIMKYVKQLENNKAVGHDGLSAKFIKLSGISLATCTSLCELFNKCIMFSHFPVDMKLAEISAVFKKPKVYAKRIIDLWIYSQSPPKVLNGSWLNN